MNDEPLFGTHIRWAIDTIRAFRAGRRWVTPVRLFGTQLRWAQGTVKNYRASRSST